MGLPHSLLILAMERKLQLSFPISNCPLQLPPHLQDLLDLPGVTDPELHPVQLLPDANFSS